MFVLAACLTHGLAAGQMPPGPLTLERVLELAEARSESLVLARAGIERAESEQLRVRSGLLPQLSASASYDRALASEFDGVFDGFGFGGSSCAPFAPDAAATIVERLTEVERAVDCGAGGENLLAPRAPMADGAGGLDDLPFGQANTWRVNLSFSQSLYSGGRIGAQTRAAAIGHRTAELGVTTARAQLLFDAAQAFYAAALAERFVRIADGVIGQAEATLLQTEARFRAGSQSEFEVLRARVFLDSQRPTLIRQRVNRELALLRLRQLLDLPADADVSLGNPLGDDELLPDPVFAKRVLELESQMDVADPVRMAVTTAADLPRAAVTEGLLAVQAREAALSLSLAQRKPIVTLNSTYGRVAYPSGAFPVWSNFRTSWTVGASVQVPILTGGRLRADEAVARVDLEQARLQLRQVEELATLDTRVAWTELVAARATWEATSGTVEQATRAYAIAEVRYSAGLSTQVELSDSRLQLQQSEANRAQAARDVQVARARVALLPDLPLGSAGAGSGTPVVVPPSVPSAPEQQTAPGGGAGQIVSTGGQVSGFGGVQ
jgi:outer membrane protein